MQSHLGVLSLHRGVGPGSVRVQTGSPLLHLIGSYCVTCPALYQSLLSVIGLCLPSPKDFEVGRPRTCGCDLIWK